MDSREALMVGMTSDGKPVVRPLSPHLQVYRLPITALMSISHRVTGVGLGFGTLLLVWWLMAAAGSETGFVRVQWFLGSIVGWLLLLGWTAALFFHFCNGIRHLWWDAGKGLSIPESEAAGKLVLGGTVVLTVLAVLVAVFA